jgi:hypothetical protein
MSDRNYYTNFKTYPRGGATQDIFAVPIGGTEVFDNIVEDWRQIETCHTGPILVPVNGINVSFDDMQVTEEEGVTKTHSHFPLQDNVFDEMVDREEEDELMYNDSKGIKDFLSSGYTPTPGWCISEYENSDKLELFFFVDRVTVKHEGVTQRGFIVRCKQIFHKLRSLWGWEKGVLLPNKRGLWLEDNRLASLYARFAHKGFNMITLKGKFKSPLQSVLVGIEILWILYTRGYFVDRHLMSCFNAEAYASMLLRFLKGGKLVHAHRVSMLLTTGQWQTHEVTNMWGHFCPSAYIDLLVIIVESMVAVPSHSLIQILKCLASKRFTILHKPEYCKKRKAERHCRKIDRPLVRHQIKFNDSMEIDEIDIPIVKHQMFEPDEVDEPLKEGESLLIEERDTSKNPIFAIGHADASGFPVGNVDYLVGLPDLDMLEPVTYSEKVGRWAYGIVKKMYQGAEKASAAEYLKARMEGRKPHKIDELANKGVTVGVSFSFFSDVLESVKTFLAPFAEKGKIVLDIITSIFSTIKDKVSATVSEDMLYFILGLMAFIVIVLIFYFFWRTFTTEVGLIISFLSTLVSKIGITITKSVKKFFKKFFPVDNDEDEDIPEVRHQLGDSPLGMIVGLVSSYLFKNELSVPRIRDINQVTRFGKDWTTSITYVCSKFQKIFALAIDHFTGIPITQERRDRKDYDAICKEFGEISVASQGMRKFAEDDGLRERVNVLYKTILERQDLYGTETLMPTEKTHLIQMTTRIREWFAQKQGIDMVAVSRPEPVWVHIMGTKGIGKTYFTEVFLSYVYHLTYGEKYKPSYRYERSVSEFHEGYYGQFAMTMDDVYQSQDVVDRTQTSMDIIKYITSQPCPLTMPGLDDKGNTFMTSKLLFTTTNTNGIPDNLGIKEAEALERRCGFPVRMEVRAEYRTSRGLLDIAKVIDSDKCVEDLYNDIWTFKLFSRLDDAATTTQQRYNAVEPRILSFSELCLLVSDRIKKSHEYNANMTKILENPEWKQQPVKVLPKVSHQVATTAWARVPKWLREPLTRMMPTGDRDEEFQVFRNICFQNFTPPTLDYIRRFIPGYNPPDMNKYVGSSLDTILGSWECSNIQQFLIRVEACRYTEGPNGEAARGFLGLSIITRCCVLSHCFPGLLFPMWDVLKRSFEHLIPDTDDDNFWKKPGKTITADIDYYADRSYDWHCKNKGIVHSLEGFLEFWCLHEMTMHTVVNGTAIIHGNVFGTLQTAYYNITKKRAWDWNWFVPNINFNFLNEFTELQAFLLSFSVTMAVIGGIMRLSRMLDNHIRPKARAQSGDHRLSGHAMKVMKSGKYNKKVHISSKQAHSNSRAYNFRQQMAAVPEVEHQVSADSWYHIRNNIAENTCYFELYFEKPVKPVCVVGFFVFGSVAFIPQHYIEWGEKLQKIVIFPSVTKGGQLEFNTSQFTIETLRHSNGLVIDGCIIEFKKTQSFKDLFNYLPTKENLDCRGIRPTLIRRVDTDGKREIVEERATECYFGTVRVQGENDTIMRQEEGIIRMVGIDSRPGWCGHVYAVKEPSAAYRVIAIHTAGFSGEAIGTPIFQEYFLKYRERRVPSMGDHPIVVQQLLVLDCPVAHLPGLEPVAAFKRRPYMPDKSSIVPSFIQTGIADGKGGILECPYDITKKPAKLSKYATPEGVRSPYLDSLVKGFGTAFTKSFTKAEQDLFEEPDNFDGIISPHLMHKKVRALTLEEAVLGVPQLHIKPLDMQTSPGFPWVMLGLKKKDIIKISEVNGVRKVTFSQQFTDFFNHQMALLKAGFLPPTYVTQTLKDELRDLDRVEAGKTRLFDAANVVDVLIARMYWAQMVSLIEQSRYDSTVQVGVNPHSYEWKSLKRRLMDGTISIHELKYIMGDVSRWDKSIFIALAYYFATYCEQFFELKEEYAIARLILIAALQTYQVSPNGLYRSHSGVCSGHYLTSIMNSVFNHFFHKVIFKHEVPLEFKYDFAKLVTMLFYGDDSVGSVDDLVRDDFNMKVLKKLFNELFGIEYTSPYKGEVNETFCSAEQLIFLKRVFHQDEITGFIMPRLAIDSIENMALWMTKGNNKSVQLDQIRDSCKSALMEWFYYGENTYEKHRRILNTRLLALRKETIKRTYLEQQQAWVEGHTEQY